MLVWQLPCLCHSHQRQVHRQVCVLALAAVSEMLATAVGCREEPSNRGDGKDGAGTGTTLVSSKN